MAARLSSLLVLSLLAVPMVFTNGAHAAPRSDSPVPGRVGVTGDMEMVDRGGVKTGFVWVDPVTDLAADAVADQKISKILFLNRCPGGCALTPGPNDARNNTSTIAKGSSVLTEFKWSQQQWDDTLACVRDLYSPYDVEVVDVDPGKDVFHHEAILAGSPSEIGLDSNIGGIAPSSCSPLNNVISFSFANSNSGSNDGDPLNMCWTVAQESAHAFGLPNHVFDCHDPMTYIPGCGKKYFRNQGYPCGEYEIKACNCSGATQNSHLELRTVFGDGTAPPPPKLEVLLPKPDATVVDGFSVYWASSDPRGVARSEVWVNGTKYKDVVGHTLPLGNGVQDTGYDITVPKLPDGYLDIEIRSYNQLDSEAIATVTVLKGSPCASADTCFDFQECNEGRCEFPVASAELGDSCDVTPQCLVGVCGSMGSSSVCTVTCNPTVSASCKDGFECKADNEGANICWPKGDTGGCCTIAGSKNDPMPWVGALIFLLGFALLRRRRA